MKPIIFFLICVLTFSSFAQKKVQRKHQIEVRHHFGYNLPFRPQLYELIEGPAQAWEFSYIRPTDGSATWEQAYHLPKIGWTFLWIDLHNPDQIGHTAAIFPNLRIPLTTHKIQSILQAGLGIGYIQKPFDPASNHKNLAIGSHLNALMQIQWQFEYELFKNTTLTAGTGLTHFSNAATKLPNLGFNIWTVSTGLRQGFGQKWQTSAPSFSRLVKIWHPFARISFGTTQATMDEPQKHPVFNLAGGARKRVGEMFSWGSHLEYQLNTSNEKILESKNLEVPPNSNHRVGLAVGGRFHFGHVSLELNQGAYLYNPSRLRSSFYNRLQAGLELSNNHEITLGVKTHLDKAEHIEIGYSYVW